MKLISKQQENERKKLQDERKDSDLVQTKSFVDVNKKINYILFCVLGF